MVSLVSWLISAIIEVFKGPLGVFLVSLVSNSIPFVSIPYLGIVAGYALVNRAPLAEAILVLISGLGATIGKLVIYLMGKAARSGLSEKTKKNVELLSRLAKRSTFLAIFLLAATPVPDDILYIPLGIMKYPLLPYFIAILLGKLIITSAVVVYTSYISYFTVVDLYTVPIWVVLTIALIYVIIKTDWYHVINEVSTYGVKGAMVRLLHYVTHQLKIKLIKSGSKASDS